MSSLLTSKAHASRGPFPPEAKRVCTLDGPLRPAPARTCKGGRPAVEGVRLLLLSAHLLAVCLVLAQDGAALLQAPQGLEGAQLVLEHGLGAAGVVGQLHGHEGEDLGQVVLEHVANDAVLLVEAGAACVGTDREQKL